METPIKIAVLGTGTAGILSLNSLISGSPPIYHFYSVHDPKTPILGIGESTTISGPNSLWLGSRYSIMSDSHELDSTVKLGVRYTGWRKHDIDSNIPPPYMAMHFNNFKIKEFCFGRFKEIWGNRFHEIIGRVDNIDNGVNSAKLYMEGGDIHDFDYVVDCRGYPTDYTDYHEAIIPVNHCLVNTIREPGDWNYTWHVAHRNGWMFGIPLKTRQGWGYLYNDTITEREDAIDDIAERFKTLPADLNLKEFKFKNYRAKTYFEGRVLKNGNRALFYEPLEALSGTFYNHVNEYFLAHLAGQDDAGHEEFNNKLHCIAEDIEWFIAYMYHGGSNYESKFWNTTKQKMTDFLHSNVRFNEHIELMRKVTEYESAQNYPRALFPTVNWRNFDREFGYNYWTDPKRKRF
jgi:hypothetical protein